MDWTRYESASAWTVFVLAFLAVAAWETRRPNRDWVVPPTRRWTVHGILLLASALISAVVLGISPVVAAVAASGNSWGLLAQSWMPFWIRVVATLLILDFTKYASHRMLHTAPWLWRFHRVHHADPDFDLSTAARVHPVEYLIVHGTTVGAVMLLASPPGAVLAYTLTSGVFSFFGHANASFPVHWETRLRRWLVTPDIHRIHHSDRPEEQNTNYGEIFPWWDKLLRSYRTKPAGDRLVIGMKGYQTIESMGIKTLLTLPFHAEVPADARDATVVSVSSGVS